jgi:hypothetical protein
VRQVEAEQVPVAVVAAAFGFSRQSVYTAKEALTRGGMAALLPGKPGPKGGHKLTDLVVDHLRQVPRCLKSIGPARMLRCLIQKGPRRRVA